MGKTSELTYAKVAEAAFYLQANGVPRPSANVVRNYLRDKSSDGVVGAQSLLQKLLNQWYREQAAAVATKPPPGLSPALHVQLEREFAEIAHKTRQENGEEIEQLREDQAALLRENCDLQEQLVALTQDLSTQVTARDALSGQIGTLTLEALALKAALVLAHDAAKTAQYELGQAHSHLETAQVCAAQKTQEALHLTEQVQRLQAELSTSLHSAERLQNKLEGETQARHIVDLAHTALQAQLVLQLGSARASGQAKPYHRGRGGHAMSRPGG